MNTSTQEHAETRSFSLFASIKKFDQEVRYYRAKKYYLYAILNFFRWLRDPTDPGGPAPKYLTRLAFSVASEPIHRHAHKMRNDPKTSEIMKNQVDLADFLADEEVLGKLPENTLGKAYFNQFSGAQSGYILNGIIYCDGHYDRLMDWEEDAKYLIKRMGATHDATHIISGYGTDMCGEILVNLFTIGNRNFTKLLMNPLSVFISFVSYFILKPKKTSLLRWISLGLDASHRGAEMGQHYDLVEVPFETLSDKPLSEAREFLGIPPHKYQEYVSEDGSLDTRGWLGSKKIIKTVSSKDPERQERYRQIDGAKYLVLKHGFGLKETMSSSKKQIIKAFEAHQAGASDDEVRSILHPSN